MLKLNKRTCRFKSCSSHKLRGDGGTVDAGVAKHPRFFININLYLRNSAFAVLAESNIVGKFLSEGRGFESRSVLHLCTDSSVGERSALKLPDNLKVVGGVNCGTYGWGNRICCLTL